MRIERKRLLERLVSSRDNGQVKVVTGVRRSGKSFIKNYYETSRNALLITGARQVGKTFR